MLMEAFSFPSCSSSFFTLSPSPVMPFTRYDLMS